MKYSLSSQCSKQIDKIKGRDETLYKKIKRKLKIFAEDPNHRSLRLHKLSGSQADSWSISIDMSLRMLFYYRKNPAKVGQKQIVFYAVGTHREVYK
jgi:mRNA-degrading endonuclease YafQ of YafQ-DinJ toxin-antitoxin module